MTRTPYPVLVQYIATTNHPYIQPYGNPLPTPIYNVIPQDEHSWGEPYDAMGTREPYDAMGTQDPGYEWSSENYGGLPQMTDQQ
jgi:hypothetical protein